MSNERSLQPEHKATNRRRTEKMNKLKEDIGQKGKDTIIDRNQVCFAVLQRSKIESHLTRMSTRHWWRISAELSFSLNKEFLEIFNKLFCKFSKSRQ